MIIVKLSGGLGNQLFQYSFGRFLSLKYKTELKFDPQLNIVASDFTPRLLGLSKYNIDLSFAEKDEARKYKFFKNDLLSKIERKLVQNLPFFNKRFVVEKGFDIINKNNLIDNCYYDGYWQSHYYFDSIAKILENDLQLNFELSEANKEFEKEIKQTNSISLHIRRGDYLSIASNSKIYSICTQEYYQKAIDFFKQKFENPVFFVFSDDINWVNENFKGNVFKIVDINQDDPSSDLYLMSKCKHNVIANSSFSWWGAWLNSNSGKIVISPKDWYVNEETNNKALASLILKDWIII
ncbi:alpha-1,2-fucosyltransferase [Flavobacterium sp. FlaQc-57]|uniref:alpha-1,2-fucosyltransferase n=1 Tax=Flavobacterium sp. FlaQc-57 TaxID=3374186 RepID=UPI0037580CC7